MKLDFSKPLKNLDGSVSEGAPLLRDVSIRALVETLDSDRNKSGEDKFKRAVLAQRLLGSSDIEVSVEEVSLIKQRIGEFFAPVLVYGAWKILEGSEDERS